MKGCKLTIEYDQGDREVWLIIHPTHGVRPTEEVVWLREGFGPDDIREAILASGWVRQDGCELRFTSASDRPQGRPFSDLIEEIMGYFIAPGVPSRELLDVQSAVAEYDAMPASHDIPLYAYAWLDMMVREDMADEARGTSDIWARSRVAIELDRTRDSRVEELLARYAQPTTRTIGRMADSIPTRRPDASGESKIG